MAVDPQQLPDDPQTLRKMVVDLTTQLDRQAAEKLKIENLVRELLEAKRARSSERLSAEQLALFEAALEAQLAEAEAPVDDHDDENGPPGASQPPAPHSRGGRKPLSPHLERKRIVHDLPDAEKHCAGCQQDLRPIGDDTSRRYEYVPASLTVVEEVCLKYACGCTVRTATKPPRPIEKSTAGASLLAQVIVAKYADHQPLHRQERIFARFGVELSRKTMGGWMGQSAALLAPLYESMKKVLLGSKVIGTDDTTVKVLERGLGFARMGRIWPYLGDREHPVVVYDYTPTRERAGPERFLGEYQGYLQADAYAGYDAFFKPGRGMTEVGCWMHARRYFIKALESDERRMGPALALIARLYKFEGLAAALTPSERRFLRERWSRPVLHKLRRYLLELQPAVLPKSPAGAAVRYTLNHWAALNRFVEDGELSIDNGAVERANRAFAIGRNNWTFFGSNQGGQTAAVLASFVASCQRAGVNPFTWFRDVLGRIASHPVNQLEALLPHRWAPATAPA